MHPETLKRRLAQKQAEERAAKDPVAESEPEKASTKRKPPRKKTSTASK
jgi:hypothetical protein